MQRLFLIFIIGFLLSICTIRVVDAACSVSTASQCTASDMQNGLLDAGNTVVASSGLTLSQYQNLIGGNVANYQIVGLLSAGLTSSMIPSTDSNYASNLFFLLNAPYSLAYGDEVGFLSYGFSTTIQKSILTTSAASISDLMTKYSMKASYIITLCSLASFSDASGKAYTTTSILGYLNGFDSATLASFMSAGITPTNVVASMSPTIYSSLIAAGVTSTQCINLIKAGATPLSLQDSTLCFSTSCNNAPANIYKLFNTYKMSAGSYVDYVVRNGWTSSSLIFFITATAKVAVNPIDLTAWPTTGNVNFALVNGILNIKKSSDIATVGYYIFGVPFSQNLVASNFGASAFIPSVTTASTFASTIGVSYTSTSLSQTRMLTGISYAVNDATFAAYFSSVSSRRLHSHERQLSSLSLGSWLTKTFSKISSAVDSSYDQAIQQVGVFSHAVMDLGGASLSQLQKYANLVSKYANKDINLLIASVNKIESSIVSKASTIAAKAASTTNADLKKALTTWNTMRDNVNNGIDDGKTFLTKSVSTLSAAEQKMIGTMKKGFVMSGNLVKPLAAMYVGDLTKFGNLVSSAASSFQNDMNAVPWATVGNWAQEIAGYISAFDPTGLGGLALSIEAMVLTAQTYQSDKSLAAMNPPQTDVTTVNGDLMQLIFAAINLALALLGCMMAAAPGIGAFKGVAEKEVFKIMDELIVPMLSNVGGILPPLIAYVQDPNGISSAGPPVITNQQALFDAMAQMGIGAHAAASNSDTSQTGVTPLDGSDFNIPLIVGLTVLCAALIGAVIAGFVLRNRKNQNTKTIETSNIINKQSI